MVNSLAEHDFKSQGRSDNDKQLFIIDSYYTISSFFFLFVAGAISAQGFLPLLAFDYEWLV